jgi:hypothetical protein
VPAGWWRQHARRRGQVRETGPTLGPHQLGHCSLFSLFSLCSLSLLSLLSLGAHELGDCSLFSARYASRFPKLSSLIYVLCYLQYAHYSLLFTLFSLLFALCSLRSAPCFLRSALCSLCSLCSLLSLLSPLSSLLSGKYSLLTPDCLLRIAGPFPLAVLAAGCWLLVILLC